MGLYEKYILPKVLHFACGMEPMMRQREKVVPQAEGHVLEVGIGSGLNLSYYEASRVTKVTGLDPSVEMSQMAQQAAGDAPVDVEFLNLPGDEIPLDDHSVDSIVVTYTLCTIPDAGAALSQMRRVLKPGGRMLVCEHGAAPDARVKRWQDRMDPLWGRLAGGCHLNRAIPDIIQDAGFAIERLETMYLAGWKPASFNYWGTAVHA